MGYSKELKARQEAQRREMRQARKRRQWQAPKPTRPIEWSDVLDTDIIRMIEAVTGVGAAIMFGRTRDGGALVVRVYDGDDRATYYLNSQFEATALANELERIAGDAQEGQEAAPSLPPDRGEG